MDDAFSLIIPFYDGDSARLASSIELITEKGNGRRIEEIIFCHNGPRNVSLAGLIESCPPWAKAMLLHTDVRGIGAGYKLGAAAATQKYLILSASDLPFGFTDLEAFNALRSSEPSMQILFSIGSKLHPQSNMAGYPRFRLMVSRLFYFARRVCLGPEVPLDGQGTFIIERELMRRILARELSDDFAFSLDLSAHAASLGVEIHELPVVYRGSAKGSSVKLGRDGARLLFRLGQLGGERIRRWIRR